MARLMYGSSISRLLVVGLVSLSDFWWFVRDRVPHGQTNTRADFWQTSLVGRRMDLDTMI